MKIVNKTLELDKPENLTVEFIEKALTNSNDTPLRWSIVKAHDNKLIIDAVLIEQ